MSIEYRYQLSSKPRKFNCPSCEKVRRYSRYVDIETGKLIDEKYGRCDREDSCGYYLNPYTDGYAHAVNVGENPLTDKFILERPKPKLKPIIPLPNEVLERTRFSEYYGCNKFLENLFINGGYEFDVHDVKRIIDQYEIGTIGKGYMKGALTIPYIDVNDDVRTIQVKQFDDNNNTVKNSWLHSIMKQSYIKRNETLPLWLEAYLTNDRFATCLFGAHLLKKYPNNPIALCEAPKTAIYGTLCYGFPDDETKYLWLAVFNKSSFNYDRCKILKGRKVLIYPDLSRTGKTYKDWLHRAKVMSKKIKAEFSISDLLERIATVEQREDGGDLADFLIEKDWRKFRGAKTR